VDCSISRFSGDILWAPSRVAAPLANLTNRAVAETKIDRIQLATAPVQTPLPMMAGDIRARSSVIVQAELNSESLRLIQTDSPHGLHRTSPDAYVRLDPRTLNAAR
jgi:hypothetical protein